MTHGSTGAPGRTEHEPTDDAHSEEDPSPATSARFRIEIDAFGRVVPRVVPPDSDAKSSDK